MSELCPECGSAMVFGAGACALDHIVNGKTCLHNQLDAERAKTAALLEACKTALPYVKFLQDRDPSNAAPRIVEAAIALCKVKK